jgi:hypothetical protein
VGWIPLWFKVSDVASIVVLLRQFSICELINSSAGEGGSRRGGPGDAMILPVQGTGALISLGALLRVTQDPSRLSR